MSSRFSTLFLVAILCHAPASAVTNVVLIVADDLGWRDLGCIEATDVLTPRINDLATYGVRFTQAYVTAPVCSPSRAGLITGRYQQRFGQETNPGGTLEHNTDFGLPVTEATMGYRFKGLGYATAWIGKSHLGATSAYHPNVRGYDEFFGFLGSHHSYVNPTDPLVPENVEDPILHNLMTVSETRYLTDAFGDECANYIKDRAVNHAGQPFFLFAPFSAAHFDHEFNLPAPTAYHTAVDAVNSTPGTRHNFAAVLYGLDKAVGQIVDTLSAKGLLNDTLIIFTSDNGGDENFGADNGILKGGKTELYEGGIRVPMIMHWPAGLSAGLKTTPVSTLDILPTAIAATGNIVPAAWQLDGVNLLPWLQGTAPAPSRSLFWRMETSGVPPLAIADVKDGLRAMRMGDMKLVKPGTDSTWELYDLAIDPDEDNNLASSPLHLAVLQQMVAEYDAWSAQMARPRWAWNDLNYATPEFVLEDISAGPVVTPYVEPAPSIEFICPELNGETCYAGLIAHGSIGIYRDADGVPGGPLVLFTTLTLPASSPTRFLYSMKPVQGGSGFNGVSYFSCVAYENNDPLNPGATEMWLLGLGPDANHRFARQVDEAGGTDHREPDTAIEGSDLVFYYTRSGGQLRRAATGLRLPDHAKEATGFTSLQYSSSFKAGLPDALGNARHGTETTHLVAHEGKLFAGQGELGTPLSGDFTGAQILIKDSALTPWRVDETLPAHMRVEVMEELTFNLTGNVTDKLLVASFSDVLPQGSNFVGVRTRMPNDEWEHSTIPNAAGVPTSIGAYAESLSLPYAFAGLSSGEIHRGIYAEGADGKLNWTTKELEGMGPIMGFATADGALYAACGLRQDGVGAAINGGLYRRVDAVDQWVLVYRGMIPLPLHSAPVNHRLITGLTTVRDPRGTAHQSMLFARSWPGVIERIDPDRDHAVTVELDVRDYFARLWNDETVRQTSVTLAYTRFTPMPDPRTGEIVHLVGLWLNHPGHPGAHFLIRHLDGTYESAGFEGAYDLRATRCMAVSPFLADEGAVFFFGGYDAAGAAAADTAWIAQGDWAAWPTLILSQPNPPLMQLAWPVTGTDWVMEASTTLGAGALWQPVGGLPTSSHTLSTQSIAPGVPAAFFRLRRGSP
jgi:arylsulfatase A-like enzyme